MPFKKLFLSDIQSYQTPTFSSQWRILVTGVTSIHGWPVYQALREALPEDRIFAVRPPKMQIPAHANVVSRCITDRAGLERIRREFRPTHVIHGAGVCDLDVCEERPAWAQAINQEGARTVAEVFGAQAYILFLSTDLVFSGNHPPARGYAEGHSEDPVSVAGKTFLAAEAEIRKAPRHCVLRLGLPIGDSITGGKGAVDFVEGRFKRGLYMTLFYDELRSCSSCGEIAEIALRVLAREASGIFHCGGKEGISLYQLGQRILAKGNYPKQLLKRLSRLEEKNGPPRIGDVSLNSEKLKAWLDKHYLGSPACPRERTFSGNSV